MIIGYNCITNIIMGNQLEIIIPSNRTYQHRPWSSRFQEAAVQETEGGSTLELQVAFSGLVRCDFMVIYVEFHGDFSGILG